MKKLTKKLNLNKETITSLNHQQMNNIGGGQQILSIGHDCSHDNSCERVCGGTKCETKHDTFCGTPGCSYMSEQNLGTPC